MTLHVDPRLVALFGSETRVRALAPLAGSTEPLTAYRIAEISGAQRTKIYAELRRLSSAGIVRELPSSGNRSKWELLDPDVRRILRRRARVVRAQDLLAEAPRLARATRRILAAYAKNPLPSRLLGKPSDVVHPSDFYRPPEKDRILASLGLQVSRHARRPR